MIDAITIDALTKTFDDPSMGKIVAVDDLNITIEDGEFLVLVGPSGCGKSTTLRCIGGLEQATEGRILLGDEDVTDKGPRQRDIALVFQDYALYPHMTAAENIGFGLKMSTDLSKEERTQKVEEIAEIMGIEDLLDKKPGELSGGQQQRVALGRAIVRDPMVFLMDEPLSNLDAKLRAKMRTEIQELQRKFDTATVYVTHNQTEAMTMGDRIAVMNDGELQQIAEPLVCYNKPTNRFVASFIGSPSMNFSPVTYDSTARVISNEVLSYPIREPLVGQIPDQMPTDLEFGIRPEHIELVDDVSKADLTLETTVIEPHGDITYVFAKQGEIELTITTEANPGIEERETIHVSFPPEFVYLFDGATGERLAGMGELTSQIDTSEGGSVEAEQ